MSDVRKDGPHFRTIRRIYRDGTTAGARVLLYPEGKLLRLAEVERHALEVEPEQKATTKARKPGENK